MLITVVQLLGLMPVGVEPTIPLHDPRALETGALLTYPEGRLKVPQQLTTDGVSHGDLSKYAAGAIFERGWL